MKHIFTISLCFLALSFSAQEPDGIYDILICPEDLNGDGVIGVQDLLLVLSEFGCSSSCEHDINQDGYVAVQDILQLLSEFGNTCGSPAFQNCGDQILHEGYNYSTVQIGEQCWFSENCRYLPEVSPVSVGSVTVPQYYVHSYAGSEVGEAITLSNYETYGVLYNHPAIILTEICPVGWHVPSDDAWTILFDYLGGEAIAGEAMKSEFPFWNGTNSSGFSGLKGGYRYSSDSLGSGQTVNLDYEGYWWSSSSQDEIASMILLRLYDQFVLRWEISVASALSVRCIKD